MLETQRAASWASRTRNEAITSGFFEPVVDTKCVRSIPKNCYGFSGRKKAMRSGLFGHCHCRTTCPLPSGCVLNSSGKVLRIREKSRLGFRLILENALQFKRKLIPAKCRGAVAILSATQCGQPPASVLHRERIKMEAPDPMSSATSCLRCSEETVESRRIRL